MKNTLVIATVVAASVVVIALSSFVKIPKGAIAVKPFDQK